MSRGRKSKYNNYIINTKWNAALYLRLSSEDGDKAESTSIESQKHLLEEFLKNNKDISLFKYYIDDGYSGTDFNRPAFKELFNDMQQIKFNTIIVKDLSRLGRNYIEAGNYIEQIFPLYNVRFIAVNDNIDSYLNPKSISELNMPLKNLINDEYARDISKKVSSAFKTMRRNGLFTNGLAPYGYKKDPNDKHHLIIDKEVVDNVKLIYDLYLRGYGIKKIAKYLNEQRIINPSGYRNFNRKDTNRLGYFWGDSTVSKILDNQMYCGDLIQGKTKPISYKIHKKVKKNREDWDIVKNTHEPIIDRDTWEKVQKMRRKATIKFDTTEKEKSFFVGKLKCADCGYSMKRLYRPQSKDKIAFDCSTYMSRSNKACNRHFITENTLRKIVWKVIKQQLKIFNNNKIKNIEKNKWMNNQEKQYNINLSKENEKLNKYRNIKIGLYEDWKLGNISESEYKNYLEDYTEKINNINTNINFLEKELIKIREQNNIRNINEIPYIVQNFINAKELTCEMIEYLIDSIEICSNNSIKIKFKYKDEYNNLLNKITKEVSYGKNA